MARKIVWTETARKQRRNILEYWTNRNKSTLYAKKLISITRNKLKLISQNPHLAKEVDFPDTRVSAMGHFSIFFKFDDNRIVVTAFWDNRQDPKKLLKILKIQGKNLK